MARETGMDFSGQILELEKKYEQVPPIPLSLFSYPQTVPLEFLFVGVGRS